MCLHPSVLWRIYLSKIVYFKLRRIKYRTWIFSSLENETRNADDALSIESRLGEQKPVKRGKGRPPKNASNVDALEQTLRVSTFLRKNFFRDMFSTSVSIANFDFQDINKWLDNTPKVTDPCSASNSPPHLSSPHSELVVDVSLTGTSEMSGTSKSTTRPHKQKASFEDIILAPPYSRGLHVIVSSMIPLVPMYISDAWDWFNLHAMRYNENRGCLNRVNIL